MSGERIPSRAAGLEPVRQLLREVVPSTASVADIRAVKERVTTLLQEVIAERWPRASVESVFSDQRRAEELMAEIRRRFSRR